MQIIPHQDLDLIVLQAYILVGQSDRILLHLLYVVNGALDFEWT